MNIVFLFIIGLSVGSFINVLIDRLPKGQEIIFGRSKCDFCRKNLAWVDLIPIISFVVLKGRCRYCAKRLSCQYPLIELSCGILFIFIYNQLQLKEPPVNLSDLIYTLIIFSGLATLVATDIKYLILPDQILIFLIIVTLIYQWIFLPGLIINNLIVGTIAFLSFLTIVILTRARGMGLGDVKLAFFMGVFLGYPNILVALYSAFLTGAGISLILIMLGKKKLKSTIAFGPFLCLSTGIAYLYGAEIWQYFTKLMGI